MKTISSLLVLGSLLSTAHAQTPATVHDNPTKHTDHRAATYQGPKVVKDSKTLGQQMVQKSKPADAIWMSVRELPVKK